MSKEHTEALLVLFSDLQERRALAKVAIRLEEYGIARKVFWDIFVKDMQVNRQLWLTGIFHGTPKNVKEFFETFLHEEYRENIIQPSEMFKILDEPLPRNWRKAFAR